VTHVHAFTTSIGTTRNGTPRLICDCGIFEPDELVAEKRNVDLAEELRLAAAWDNAKQASGKLHQGGRRSPGQAAKLGMTQ
jgi:hypothetical protein